MSTYNVFHGLNIAACGADDKTEAMSRIKFNVAIGGRGMCVIDDDETGMLFAHMFETSGVVFGRMEGDAFGVIGRGTVVKKGNVRAGKGVIDKVEAAMKDLLGCGGGHATREAVDHYRK